MDKVRAYLKALMPLLIAGVALAVQWVHTGSWTWSQEFVTALTGVVAAIAVAVARNLPSDPARKAFVATALAAVGVVVQALTTGGVGQWGEFITAAEGLGFALLVYYVPNLGPLVNGLGSFGTRADDHRA
jgi:hypothetical protein